ETQWSSTFLMLDHVLTLFPAIEAFASHPKQADSELSSLLLNKAEVCIAKHIREVVEIPHLAQELLSTDRTPTLAFSLPVYDRIITQWESKQQKYPLLAPSIQVGITKLKEYIAKAQESQIYAFTIGTY
ncbi:hypothetical protein BDM02DRAFT_3210814, partial [Thelephora ganbajun]